MAHYNEQEFTRHVRAELAKKKLEDEALALAKSKEVEARRLGGIETPSSEGDEEDFSPEVEAAMAAGYAAIETARTSTKKD